MPAVPVVGGERSRRGRHSDSGKRPEHDDGRIPKRTVEDTSLQYADPQLAGVTARTRDVGRDSGKNPPPVNKITDYFYDPSGNVTVRAGIRKRWICQATIN